MVTLLIHYPYNSSTLYFLQLLLFAHIISFLQLLLGIHNILIDLMELSSFDVNLFSVSPFYGTFFIIEKGWSFNFNILLDHSHAAFMQRYVMPCLFPLSIISLLNTSLCFINKSGNEYSIVPSFTGVDKGGTRGHRRVKKTGGGERKSVGKWSMPLHKTTPNNGINVQKKTMPFS